MIHFLYYNDYNRIKYFCFREVKARHEETEDEDEDVAKERTRVLAGGATDEALMIQNLTKVFNFLQKYNLFIT